MITLQARNAASTPSAPPATPSPEPGNPTETGWLPLGVVLAGVFVVVLDFFIVNVGLPSIQAELHAGDTGVEWIVAGFGLAYGGLLLAGARLGDRWGRRRMFGTGVALFTLTSAACGVATTMQVLVAARIGQGVAGALLTPMVLALIGDLYDGPRRVRAIGAYSTAMGLAAASGQLIGGALIHLDVLGLGWRSIFLVNVPVGLTVLALLPCLPVGRPANPPRIDLAELLMAVGSLTAVTLPLLEGRRLGWPSWTWITLAAGLLLAGLLVVRGLDPLASGATFTFVAASYLVGTGRAGALVARWGSAAIPVGAGIFLSGHLLTLAAVVEVGHGSVLWLAPGLVLAGFGMGVCLTSQIATVMATVEPRLAGAVSGTLSTAQQIGNTLGVALIGVVYFGALPLGHQVAFERGLLFLVAVTATLAVLAGLLARRGRAGRPRG